MKIALIINSAPPFPVSGSEQQGMTMAACLAARGHRVTLFARRYGGAPVVDPMDGYTLIRVPFLDMGPLRFPSHCWNFDRLFARHGADADVILAYQTFAPGYLGARAARRHRIPCVLWIRSTMGFMLSHSPRLTWAMRQSLPHIDHLLFQSERLMAPFLTEVRHSLGDRLADRAAARMSVGRNAVAMRATEPSPGNELLVVGRLIELKDLPTLFRALRRMKTPPPTRLVGDGPILAALQSEAAGLPVTFAGRMAPDQLPGEYRRARVLAMTSTTEGMPNVILEAMASGVPVVSTPVGSIPDVVKPGETGYLFPVADDEALAGHLTRLFSDDPLRDRLARGALNQAGQFSWERVTDGVEEVLGRVGMAPVG
ncbi:MAG TPA: glycosyltransferase family 4 protein [Candidatus Eisenbacteria bacterium]